MAAITDRGMQAKPVKTDRWLIQPFIRGAGVFVGRIRPSGERLFYFRYTDSKGRRPFLPIGPYHPKGEAGWTVSSAYDRAAELSALYRSGARDLREHIAQVEQDRRRTDEALRRDAQEREKAAVQEAQRRLTTRQLFERWCSTQLQPRLRADGRRSGRVDAGRYVREQFERHVFPLIGDRGLTDLRKVDLLALLDAQTSAGKLRTANMLLADLKQMFDFAVERDLIAANPLTTVKRRQVGGPSVERERTLSDDEVKLLARALTAANMSPRSAIAIWLMLATGARLGEVMGAVWADARLTDLSATKARTDALVATAAAAGVKLGFVDTAARAWHLPTTKNQRDHTIHLSGFALAQFEKLRDLREVQRSSANGELSPWVFPATDNSRPVCVKSFGKQLADRQRPADKRLRNRTKATTALLLPGGKWTAHDLRRTSATFMARLGFGSDVINEALNHMQRDRMARVYIQDRREAEQIRAFDALGERLAKLARLDDVPPNDVPSSAT